MRAPRKSKGPKLSRKEQRKKSRTDKKLKKHEFYTKKNTRLNDQKQEQNSSKGAFSANKSGKKKFNKFNEFSANNQDGGQSPANSKALKKPVTNESPTNNSSQGRLEKKNGVKAKKSKGNKKTDTVFEKKPTNLLEEKQDELNQVQKEVAKLQKDFAGARRERLKAEAEADDLEIKKLEKRLGLKKRSEKSKSKYFASDGLDYILDFCNDKKEGITSNINESDDDFGDDFALVMGKKRPKKTKEKGGKKAKLLKPRVGEDEDSSGSEPEEYLSSKGGGTKKTSKIKDEESEDGDGGSESEHSENSEEMSGSDFSGVGEEEENLSEMDGFSDNEDSSENDEEEVSSVALETSEKKSKKSMKILVEDEGIKQKAKRPPRDDVSELESGTEEEDEDSVMQKLKERQLSKQKSGVSKSVTKMDKEEKKVMELLKAQKASKAKESCEGKKSGNKELGDGQLPWSDDDEIDSDDFAEDGDDTGEEKKEKKADGTWEDIYGRTRDKEGNVVVAKYQPPHLRNTLNSSEAQEKLGRLKKQMKGLLNRLAENNMASISSQVEALFGQHSRNETNESLWALYQESLIAETATPERLVAEHALLLAVLSANVGSEVAAHCLQRAVNLWHQLYSHNPTVPDKRTNNLLLLLSFMCHLKLFHCSLLYDILNELLKDVKEKQVELVLLVLRTVGFSLRKEDPVRLKDFVLKTQKLVNDTDADTGSRARFLVDTVMAIKNNNVNKIPNYNPEYGEQLKKTLRACVRKGNYSAELKISLEDLLKADERGRWWVVGSAWTGDLPGEKPPEALNKKKESTSQGFSTKLLELAKKQRMNTDARRSVFCVMMSSEDYLDAFEKLIKLKLHGANEREVMNVMLHCLLQERRYNPYYEHLAKKFCQANRKYQIMLQYATWDKIQDLASLSSSQVGNLAKFLGHLIVQKSLAISVLKVVELGGLDKSSMRFMRQVLLNILLSDSDEDVLAVFARVAASNPLKTFKESLRLFLHHFVLRNTKEAKDLNMELLTTRVKIADQALSASERSFAF